MVALIGSLLVRAQALLPQHAISRFVGWLARRRQPLVKNLLIAAVSRLYKIDLADAAQTDRRAYPTFNDFFTRALAPTARDINSDPAQIVSPVDGTVSQCGQIGDGQLLQAKGRRYLLSALLAADGAEFDGGRFATIYLAPDNYHRVHLPMDATLTGYTYVPGRLFSVNDATAQTIANVFARNERVVFDFTTDDGPMALVMVGALNVGSIETVHDGVVAPARQRLPHRHQYREPHPMKKGAELARFNLGSTVILVFGPNQVEWQAAMGPGHAVRLGESIAQRIDAR